MAGFPVFASRRLRSTPYTERVEASGLSGYTVYNHMLLPASFESLEADAAHLKKYVQIWDVAGERQVEVVGPDARMLSVMMSARDLTNAVDKRCYYAPICDHKGGMINDPIALCLGEDRFWFSIADSDMLLWAKGLATAMKLDVEIFEPDVSPLAIQGPLADDLMAEVFGEAVRDIKFFRFERFAWRGRDLIIARSGWSKQGGFEIYLDDSKLGVALWDDIAAKGEKYNLRAGCPNLIERIEGGLLSLGNDMTIEDTPMECGLAKYVSLDSHDFIGRDALLKQREDGVQKQLMGLVIEGDMLPPVAMPADCFIGDEKVGFQTSGVYSPDFGQNLGFAMMFGAAMQEGTQIEVETVKGRRKATVTSLPFQS
ncbi:MAG: dimethylsulfoniopropionate demethylase [Candidatus Puniceispirillaceae bacterium]